MSRHEHETARELLAPMALGAVTERERDLVNAHVERCVLCHEELHWLRDGADVLALSAPPMTPPRSLKRSLMSTVRAEAAASAARSRPAPAHLLPRARAGLASLWPWPALAGAAVAIAFVLVGWNVALLQSTDPAPDPREVIAVTQSGVQGIEARVLYIPNEDTATISVSGLRPPGDAKGYELWVIEDGQARSARFLQLQGPAEAVGVASGVRGAEALGITRESLSHDRSAPTTPLLVRIPLPA